jgi:hypothetical protein
MNKSGFKKYGRRKSGSYGRTRGYSKNVANRAVRRDARTGDALSKFFIE